MTETPIRYIMSSKMKIPENYDGYNGIVNGINFPIGIYIDQYGRVYNLNVLRVYNRN